MKENFRNIISQRMFKVVLALIFIIAGSSFFHQPKLWEVPASADAKKNPLKSDAPTIAAGKTIYVKECQSCHGKKGKGDGTSAAQLDVQPGDFTSTVFKKETDGALAWKTSEGRKPMPSFKKKLTEEQIWQTIVYMRTF